MLTLNEEESGYVLLPTLIRSTYITVKELLNIVTELRHLDGIMGNFGICDGREYLAAATIKEKQAVPQLIYSNVKEVIEQQQNIFESFWHRATPAEQKIAEIEEGIVVGTTEVLQDPQITKETFVDMIKSAEKEVLLFCPTANAFLREQRIGIIDRMIEAATTERKFRKCKDHSTYQRYS